MIKRKTSILLLTCLPMFLSGCFDGDGGSDNDGKIGRLTVTGIEGVRYQTNQFEGHTNEDGEFRYYEGETISFWIGNLPIASDVPAKPILTPLDFNADNREALRAPTKDRYNLSTHAPVERRLADADAETINITRLLLILDDDKSNSLGEDGDNPNNVRITDWFIRQFNAALNDVDVGTIDLSEPPGRFASLEPQSPINKVLAQMCFHPEDDWRCGEPHSDELIAEEEAKLDDMTPETEEYDQQQRYVDALKNENDQIAAYRTLDDLDSDSASSFIKRETAQINSVLARDYYLTPFEFTIPASDTSIKTVTVRKPDSKPDLTELEAITTNEDAVYIHSYSAETREVDFFVTGEPGSEGEVRVAFRPAKDYRWYQLQIRPLITE